VGERFLAERLTSSPDVEGRLFEGSKGHERPRDMVGGKGDGLRAHDVAHLRLVQVMPVSSAWPRRRSMCAWQGEASDEGYVWSSAAYLDA
jgi:hypothetical protein